MSATVTQPYGPAPYPTASPLARPRPPSWMTRIALGILVLVGIYLVLVVMPGFLFTSLRNAGIPVPAESANFVLVGSLVAVTGAVAYVLRPTRAYGPAAIACDIAEIAYLLLIYQASPIQLSLNMGGGGSNNGIAIGVAFTLVIVIFLLVQLIHLVGDAVTTAEDLRHPNERLWWSYPVR